MATSPENRDILLAVAGASIRYGLGHGRPLPVSAADYAPELGLRRATFVTLQRRGELRGCIGMLEAVRPLVEDVAHNAYAAAFSDPRFPPLGAGELEGLELHLSILSPPEQLPWSAETDLVQQLRPGIDGLILSDRGRRGTFLPSVWESLPTPVQFLRHLKQKAGLPADYWSATLQVSRYTTESFGGPLPPES